VCVGCRKVHQYVCLKETISLNIKMNLEQWSLSFSDQGRNFVFQKDGGPKIKSDGKWGCGGFSPGKFFNLCIVLCEF